MKIETKIARIARQKLGRPAFMRKGWSDWEAADAVGAAARQCGLTSILGQWVRPGLSVRRMAQAFVDRYCQAYGPVEGRIDISQQVGSKTPVIVTL